MTTNMMRILFLFWLAIYQTSSYCQGALNPAPTLFLPLSQSHKEKDIVGNGNNGILNDVTLVQGPGGQSKNAYQLTGKASSYISVKRSTALDAGKNGALTVVGFVRPDTSRMKRGPLLQFQGEKDGPHVWIIDNALYVNFGAPTTDQLKLKFPSLKFRPRRWQFFAASYDKVSGTAIGFVEGASEVKSGLAKINLDTTQDLFIGKRPAMAGKWADEMFKGGMSCIMMFNQALSVADMKRMKDYCLARIWIYPTFDPLPMVFWPLNKHAKEYDVSGNEHHATPYDVTLSTGPYGKEETAYKFYGRSSSHMKISGDTNVAKDGSFTFTAFLKLRVVKKMPIIEWRGGAHVWCYPLENVGTNLGLRTVKTFTSLTFTANSWYFLGVSYDKNSGKTIACLNAVCESASEQLVVKTDPTILYLGKREHEAYFDGKMSCVMLFNKSMTVEEMKRVKDYCNEIYNIKENMYPAPVGFWPMNNKAMTKDVSGNGNDGVGYDLKLARGPSGARDTAFQFSGTANSYMQIPQSDFLNLGVGGSFSYTSYINTDKQAGCYLEWKSQTYIWSWRNKELQTNFPFANSQRFYNPQTLPIEYNKWLFLGVSYDTVAWNLTLRVNENVQFFSINPKYHAKTTGAIFVGIRKGGGSVEAASPFRGLMSCVALYDVALTLDEMERARKFCLAYQNSSNDGDHMYPSPIGFWPMNSKTMTKDVSGNCNNGVGYGLKLAAGPSGAVDTALQFSGTANSYMVIPKSAMLDVGAAGSFSYTSYINTDRKTGCYWEWLRQTWVWSWEDKEISAAFLSRVSNERFHNAETLPIEYNKWLFIGVSFDTAEWKLVLKVNDDVRNFSISPKNKAKTTETIYIGTRPGDANGYFRGRMSCVMLYDVALTSDEMERARKYCLAYQKNSTSLEGMFSPAPVGYWPMTSETKGNDLSSGNCNNATLHGVTFTDGPTGIPGGAIQFHGKTTSYLSMVKSSTLDLAKSKGFAFTAYVKFDSGTGSPILEWPGTGTRRYGLHIWMFPSQNLFVNLMGVGSQTKSVAFDMKFTHDVWTFIGITYNVTGRLLGYMDTYNPESQEITVAANIITDTSSSEVWFGRRLPSHFLNGAISCAMLFNRPLSLNDMKRAQAFCSRKDQIRKSNWFQLHSNAKIKTQNLLKEYPDTPTELHCLELCSKDVRCESSSYTARTKTCLSSQMDYFGENKTALADEASVLYSVKENCFP